MANTADPLVVCFLVPLIFLPHMLLDRTAKDVIWRGVISYNSSKLLLNVIILKNREKDRELVVSAMARYLL
jgi:hypothetical protein